MSLYDPAERVFNLIPDEIQDIPGMSLPEAIERVASGDAQQVAAIGGSFALVGWEGIQIRMARTLDRPLRFFLGKRVDGPILVVSDRIDTIRDFLISQGMGDQFHPSYTRMVPAHHVLDLTLRGCPDPNPRLSRFFDPPMGVDVPEIEVLGRRYAEALSSEISRFLGQIPMDAPVGVAFSGGIDSGAVLLIAHHLMESRGWRPQRLKAFTLSLAGGGADLEQARAFLDDLGLGFYLETIEAAPEALDPLATVALVEDYKPLDIQAASAFDTLLAGIRQRYPEWRYLLDGDGGDENLKDYPLLDGAELTIRSVLGNRLLYQEGWGVDAIKHSQTFSGGQSRSVTRGYAPLRRHGFVGFSPHMQRPVIAAAEAIPFITLTDWDRERLYALKGAIVAEGVRQLTGLSMPTFPKRRFQEGAMDAKVFEARLAADELTLRQHFHALWR